MSRHNNSSLRGALGLLLVALSTACLTDRNAPTNVLYSCSEDSDCPDENTWRCRTFDEVCVLQADWSSTPPIDAIALSYVPDGTVEVRFTAKAALQEEPTVLTDCHGASGRLDATQTKLETLEYVYTVAYGSILDICDQVEVMVEAVDVFGNSASVTESIEVGRPLQTCEGAIEFPDSNLETAVRAALGRPQGDISSDDVRTVRNLDPTFSGAFDGRNIADLRGLECFFGLEFVVMRQNQIFDLSPLAGLSRLIVIDLQGNPVAAPGPIAGLTGLRVLNLADANLTDITSLAGLTNLEELFLDNNNVSSLSALSGMSRMSRLSLPSNQFSSIAPLSGMTALSELDISQNGVSDISALAGKTNFTKVLLQENSIADVSALESLAEVEIINLADNQVSDLEPLAANLGLSSGDTLILQNNPFDCLGEQHELWVLQTRGVSVISACPYNPCYPDPCNGHGSCDMPTGLCTCDGRGMTADCGGCAKGYVDSYPTCTPPAGCEGVITFSDANLEAGVRAQIAKPSGDLVFEDLLVTGFALANRNIQSLEGAQCFAVAESLYLPLNPISDLTPLAGLAHLKSLTLENNAIDDLSPLAGLTALEELSLGSNQISEISALSGLSAMTTLRLSGNQIADISALTDMVHLIDLDLGFNQVADIGPLEGLTALTTLRLWYNQVVELGPLSGLVELNELRLENNQVVNLGPLVENTGLGGGDTVFLDWNPVGCDDGDLQTLRARGVTVNFENGCVPGLDGGTPD